MRYLGEVMLRKLQYLCFTIIPLLAACRQEVKGYVKNGAKLDAQASLQFGI